MSIPDILIREDGARLLEGFNVTPTEKNWFIHIKIGNEVQTIRLPRNVNGVARIYDKIVYQE